MSKLIVSEFVMPKFVATTTLDDLAWNNSTPISENIEHGVPG